MRIMTTTLALLAVSAILASTSATPTLAACYEDIGCPSNHYIARSDLMRLSCQNLWLVRNQIYNERGYCFKTSAAIAQFDNSDCTIEDQADVPLNKYERKNISRIRSVETAKGC